MNKDGIPLPSALSGVQIERLIRIDEALLFLVLGALVELTDDWWLEQTGSLTSEGAKDALNAMLWEFMGEFEVTAVGTVAMHAGVTLPAKWLSCDGQSVLRSAWPKLFTAIGTIWGSVDSTHFNLPNLRDRSPIGWNAAGTNQGQYAGAFTHAITVGELPTHQHTIPRSNNVSGGTIWRSVMQQAGLATGGGLVDNTGSGNLLSLLHPVAPLMFIIYAGE